MASQVLTDLITQVQSTRGVIQSTTVFLGGLGLRIQAAIDAALANGATAAELAPLTDLQTALASDTAALSAAVAANA